jgi:hypothetical protein
MAWEVRYLVEAAIANRLGRGQTRAALQVFRENLAVPWFRFHPMALFYAHCGGSPNDDQLFTRATSVEEVLPAATLSR